MSTLTPVFLSYSLMIGTLACLMGSIEAHMSARINSEVNLLIMVSSRTAG